jgi:hypothetical protein
MTRSRPELETSECLMELETDASESTETDHAKNSQKKMEQSDKKEKLGIDSEKIKVKIIKLEI